MAHNKYSPEILKIQPFIKLILNKIFIKNAKGKDNNPKAR